MYYSDKENFDSEYKYYRDNSNLDKNSKSEIIQFNLNKLNEEFYDTVLKEHSVQNESEFLRNLFLRYISNPRHIREKIVFANIVKSIDLAMKEKKKISIKFNGTIRTINPYFIQTASEEDRDYLFCFCEYNQEHRNYRISNIISTSISSQTMEHHNMEYIEKIQKNFDAFLSYEKKVVIKINDAGKTLYDRIILNKPKILETNNDIWTLQCSNMLAKVFFPQFLSNVEILEPIELRVWFENEFGKAVDIYRDKCKSKI